MVDILAKVHVKGAQMATIPLGLRCSLLADEFIFTPPTLNVGHRILAKLKLDDSHSQDVHNTTYLMTCPLCGPRFLAHPSFRRGG